MSAFKEPRKAYPRVIYNGADISIDISADLLSFDYSDSLNEADEISIVVMDREHKWRGSWYPKVAVKAESSSENADDVGTSGTVSAVPGSILEAEIITQNWNEAGQNLNCGHFEIDGMDISINPDTASIKATSIPLTSSIRRQEKSRAWEAVSLKQIAGDIAEKAGLSLVFELDEDIQFDRLDQVKTSDIKFLKEICLSVGVMLKVSDAQLILFYEAKYEQRPSVLKIDLEGSSGSVKVLSGTLKQSTDDTASSAELSYKDPKSGELVTGSFTPESPPATGQTLSINERPSDLRGDDMRNSSGAGTGAAKISSRVITDFSPILNDPSDSYKKKRSDTKKTADDKAKSQLRQQNRLEYVAELSVVGNTLLIAGVTVDILNAGIFTGKYIVEKASHSLSASGYTTSISAHRVLEGY